MKYICIIFLVLLLGSCDENETECLLEFPQEWQLYSMNMGLTGTVIPQNNMPWQENLQFLANGIFIKTRTEGKISVSAYGTYNVEGLYNGEEIELTYKDANDLVAGCNSREVLTIDGDIMTNSGWIPCDGPILTYEKLNPHCLYFE